MFFTVPLFLLNPDTISDILSSTNQQRRKQMDEKITLLVIDQDISYAKSIVNFAKSHSAFFDAAYATTGTDGIDMMEDIKPTAAIINFLLPGLDAIGILRQLKRINETIKPFIVIAATAMTSAMISTATEYGADYFMIKPQPPSEICNTIVDLLSSTPNVPVTPTNAEDNFDIRLSKFLHYLGIPAHLNGYSYIRSALKLAIDDISVISPITQKLYPQLACEYGKSPECVERSMRHAIKVSWERGNKKVLHDIFGVAPDNPYYSYPTNSEYIAMLADDLRLRLKHNIAI